MGSSDATIALTLSGGGFRATLFHLGLVRFLYDARLLHRVTDICSVSGGSILAAHLALHWDRYTDYERKGRFEEAAAEVVNFVKQDVRGRVVRRWLFGCLTFLRWLAKDRWTRTRLLEGYYADLYGHKRLKELEPGGTTPRRPRLYLLATSLTTGKLCSFGSMGEKVGFCIHGGDPQNDVVLERLPIAFAVTASSAFPPLFPPVALSGATMRVSKQRLPYDAEYLADGGVYENLGIRMLRLLQKRSRETNGPSHDFVVVSDAQGVFDYAPHKRFGFIVPRTVRATDILMKRVSDLEYDNVQEGYWSTSNFIRCQIQREIAEPGQASIDAETQRAIAMIRTDLDRFSAAEIDLLVRHGYGVARTAWRDAVREGRKAVNVPVLDEETRENIGMIRTNLDKGSEKEFRLVVGHRCASAREVHQTAAAAVRPVEIAVPAGSPWSPLTEAEVNKAGEPDISRSHAVHKRLWYARDWVSWATLLVLALYATGLLGVQRLLTRAEVARETQGFRTDIDRLTREKEGILSAYRLQLQALELMSKGDHAGAVEPLERAKELIRALAENAPDDIKLQVELGFIHKSLALAYEGLGDRERADKSLGLAFATFQRVRDHVSAGAEGTSNLASALNGLGNLYYARKDYAKAIEHCRLAVVLHPSYAYAWHDLLLAYIKLAETERVDPAAVRQALQKLKETGAGRAGLGKDELEWFDEQVRQIEARQR